MRVYVAALYAQKDRVRDAHVALRAAGHEPVSRWVDVDETDSLERYAHLDVEDVKRADCVLTFSLPHGTAYRGGGRHFELGLGYALGKRCIVVGEREMIFHHLRDVEVCATLYEALERIGRA